MPTPTNISRTKGTHKHINHWHSHTQTDKHWDSSCNCLFSHSPAQQDRSREFWEIKTSWCVLTDFLQVGFSLIHRFSHFSHQAPVWSRCLSTLSLFIHKQPRSHTNWLYCAYWLHWLKYLWAQPQTRVADWSTAQYLNRKTWHQEQPSKLRGDAVLSICLSDWEDLKPWISKSVQQLTPSQEIKLVNDVKDIYFTLKASRLYQIIQIT